MRLAIMQPYIFPYIGYYQLINAVDKFIIYDDVNYINKGWINRNNIIVNNKSFLFTIPLKEASQNKLIREIELADDDGWKNKLLKTIEQSYRKAPYFGEIFALVQEVIGSECTHIYQLTTLSLFSVAKYLDMQTEFISSSTMYDNGHLKAQERILDICLREKAGHYINPVGGMEIYSRDLFTASGININFIKSKSIEYQQLNKDFVPYLSIIDVLMLNPKEKVKEMLHQFELL